MTDYRELAREWCEVAVNGDVGRMVDDPVYQWVVEKRDKGPSYSSCADLAHWMLFRLGVRSRYVNRTEHFGWKPIVNVGRLCCRPVGGNSVARAPDQTDTFGVGDVLICWKRPDTTDAHVMVCASHEGGTLLTWDYGQGPMSPAAWSTRRNYLEGCRKVRNMVPRGGLWTLSDGRVIRSWLPLDAAIEAAREAGELVDPDLPVGEVLDEKVPE